jgi:hypothetical protein
MREYYELIKLGKFGVLNVNIFAVAALRSKSDRK